MTGFWLRALLCLYLQISSISQLPKLQLSVAQQTNAAMQVAKPPDKVLLLLPRTHCTDCMDLDHCGISCISRLVCRPERFSRSGVSGNPLAECASVMLSMHHLAWQVKV